MAEPIAVLVEDDPEQSEFSSNILSELGFDVRAFGCIADALDYLKENTELIDLFVLDRRLPVNPGELVSDEFGDELLRTVRSRFTDARIIVFTGFATISHVQQSLEGSGQLPTQDRPAIDRVTVLEKSQSIEFKEQASAFRGLVQSFDNIEVKTTDTACTLSYREKRAIRRLAYEYRADSASVTPLSGGLTGDPIWLCNLSRAEGLFATLVAKRLRTLPVRGGLMELLPRVNTAATLSTLSGMMGGTYLTLLQLAGKDAFPLMRLIESNPDEAVRIARPLWAALHGIANDEKVLPVAQICTPLIAWERLTELLKPYGISIPPGTLTATVKMGLRHGDFHPLNVLVDGEHAVLIDYDGPVIASGVLDPLTMMVSTLVHPASPIRADKWPAPSEIGTSFGELEFGAGHAQAAWFHGVTSWFQQCRTSDREGWAMMLAKAGRQLEYPNVTCDAEIVGRVIAIARRAASALAET